MARPTLSQSPPGQTRERVYQFMRQQILAGLTPTIREVQEAMQFRAIGSAQEHIHALVTDGRLIKDAGRARGYRLPSVRPLDPPTVLVPLLGEVQAGDLTLALESADDHIAVQCRHAPADLFALTVRGRSMVDAGILPGDVVVVRRQPTANDGEIVVALVEDEATVKTLRRLKRKHYVQLCPANSQFKPIVLSPNDVVILGKVIQLHRNF